MQLPQGSEHSFIVPPWVSALVSAAIVGGISWLANVRSNTFHYGKLVERIDNLIKRLDDHMGVEHKRLDTALAAVDEEQTRQWKEITGNIKAIEYFRGILNGKRKAAGAGL